MVEVRRGNKHFGIRVIQQCGNIWDMSMWSGCLVLCTPRCFKAETVF